MNSKYVGAAALGLLALAIAGGVIIAGSGERQTLDAAPAVTVDPGGETGETRIEAPFASVERDKDGTRVKAPGVDIEIPKRSTE